MIIVSEEKKTLLENLALLNHLISFISTSLDMDIDTSLYKNKIIIDLFFITKALPKIEKRVIESSLNAEESMTILKKVKNVKDGAIILMESIISYKYKQAVIFESYSDDIKGFINSYKNSSANIQKKLNIKLFTQNGHQVSKEELHFLFGQEKSENTA